MLNKAWIVKPDGTVTEARISLLFELRRMTGQSIMPAGGVSGLAAINNIAIVEMKKYAPLAGVLTRNRAFVTIPDAMARAEIKGARQLVNLLYTIQADHVGGQMPVIAKYVKPYAGKMQVIKESTDSSVTFFDIRLKGMFRRSI